MSSDMAVIRTFSNDMDAEMAQELLYNEGIESFIFKDDGGGMELHMQLTGGVRLLVSRTYAERAFEILQTFSALRP